MSENNLQEKEERRKLQINFWGSLALSVFAVVYLFFASQIKNISTAKWYDSPSLFPIVIGGCLLVFCLIYLWQNRGGFLFSSEDASAVWNYFTSRTFFRLVLSVATLAVYVFVLLGFKAGTFRLPYEGATFIYLFVTMLCFRPKGYAVWKIFAISIALSFAVGYGFSHFARIPLP